MPRQQAKLVNWKSYSNNFLALLISLNYFSAKKPMVQYLALMQDILSNGTSKTDRTGTGTLSVFGRQMRFNLKEGFPLLTTKKLHIKSIIYELLWFLNGDTNVKYLNDHGVTIWDEWADDQGYLGPIYGSQWRSWPAPNGERIDQISSVIEQIITNPDSRRHIVTAWNPAEINQMALPPCHVIFQFYVANGRLSCQLYQRSADYFLGVPFNIASYALLTNIFAHLCGLQLGEFIWTGGDIHLYNNHLEQAHNQLNRTPYKLPQLVIKNKRQTIFQYQFEDFEITNYTAHPSIKAPIAI